MTVLRILQERSQMMRFITTAGFLGDVRLFQDMIQISEVV